MKSLLAVCLLLLAPGPDHLIDIAVLQADDDHPVESLTLTPPDSDGNTALQVTDRAGTAVVILDRAAREKLAETLQYMDEGPYPLKRVSDYPPLSKVCLEARKQGKSLYLDRNGVTHLCPLRRD